MGSGSHLFGCKKSDDTNVLARTQRRNLRQLSRLRDKLDLFWVSRAYNWETEPDLAILLHLIEDRRPSRIPP